MGQTRSDESRRGHCFVFMCFDNVLWSAMKISCCRPKVQTPIFSCRNLFLASRACSTNVRASAAVIISSVFLGISSFPVSLILSTVICNFRGSVTQGLALEVGETVQILEKCEGKASTWLIASWDAAEAEVWCSSDVIDHRYDCKHQ